MELATLICYGRKLAVEVGDTFRLCNGRAVPELLRLPSCSVSDGAALPGVSDDRHGGHSMDLTLHFSRHGGPAADELHCAPGSPAHHAGNLSHLRLPGVDVSHLLLHVQP